MHGDDPRTTALDAVADALLEAHRQAEHDADPVLMTLIENALLHLGRRIASQRIIGFKKPLDGSGR